MEPLYCTIHIIDASLELFSRASTLRSSRESCSNIPPIIMLPRIEQVTERTCNSMQDRQSRETPAMRRTDNTIHVWSELCMTKNTPSLHYVRNHLGIVTNALLYVVQLRFYGLNLVLLLRLSVLCCDINVNFLSLTRHECGIC